MPKKKMEDMTREELLKEFEGPEDWLKVPRRPKNKVLLALRVPPDFKRRLSEEAERRGVSGYTTMARMILEEGLTKPSKSIVNQIATKTAEKVVAKLKRSKKATASKTEIEQSREHKKNGKKSKKTEPNSMETRINK